jgi:hypothetical protein
VRPSEGGRTRRGVEHAVLHLSPFRTRTQASALFNVWLYNLHSRRRDDRPALEGIEVEWHGTCASTVSEQ